MSDNLQGSGQWGRRGHKSYGRRKGRGNRFRSDSDSMGKGLCVCPECSFQQNHNPGQTCFQEKCPQCGSRMIRK